MLRKHKRILWLLNHKTLMPYEANLLSEIGFEVFVPKIIPQSASFRSGMIDFSYDATLSLPGTVLQRLNSFDFYQSTWPRDIVTLVNRYFGAAFVIPYGKQVAEAVKKFDGQILFRAFGLDNTITYLQALTVMYGHGVLSDIYAIRHRFWFAQGYEQLTECEPPLLSERAIFLPLGVPKSFWQHGNQWIGSTRRILFICPHVKSNPYYAQVYRDFKKEFGYLPHTIVGAQDVAVDDPHLLGYVTDEQLQQLYRECAVLYYHSRELRHLHYSPIEAVIVGTPIVFYNESLLGRLCRPRIEGGVDTTNEARNLIQSILLDSDGLAQRLSADQRRIADCFSDSYCRRHWRENFAKVSENFRNESTSRIFLREAWRGITSVIPSKKTNHHRVPRAQTLLPHEELSWSSMEEGIDFRKPQYPAFVRGVDGLSFNEFWGRWSTARRVSIEFEDPLRGCFDLIIVGGGYGKNIGQPFKIKIGNCTQRLVVSSFPAGEKSEKYVLHFVLRKPAFTINIDVPYPTVPENDNRAVGLGLVHLRVVQRTGI